MNWVESAGLAKFDLLGLKTLTAVDEILSQLLASRINAGLECFGDRKAFQLICAGKVLGTFQLESKGMRKHIEHMLPSNLSDLAALIALYRPGPMKHIRLYSDIKSGKVARVSLHQAIDHILDETYGIVIYQEQVMLIAQKLAGFSLSEADVLRKAMAKKDMNEMLVQKHRFLSGATANGVSHTLASSVFSTLARFADYGFNKSHAVAYSALAYITAHLKASFPLEFYAVNMTVEITTQSKMSELYYEAVAAGIQFAAPSVQKPLSKFKTGNGFIQFPLNSIKGIGSPVVNSISASRAQKPFASLADFCVRIDPRVVNKRVLKSLVSAGALDCFGQTRLQMLASLETISSCAKTKASHPALAAASDGSPATLAVLYEEYLLLGCYVSESPCKDGDSTEDTEASADAEPDTDSTLVTAAIVAQFGKQLILITSSARLEV